MSRIDRAIEALKDVAKLKERGHHFHKRDAYIGGADSVKDRLHGEPISERAFVRAFGDKVKRVRLSNRADFVGLMIMGNRCGFTITKPSAKVRRLRVLGINNDGSLKVTTRYIDLKENDSLTNLQKGLLRWVQ